ncbi:hypothetical protein JW890_08460 [candidate division WOR-3 bacterium]|nr:hypothetical protein [candidate division WOR-3 bacterium]
MNTGAHNYRQKINEDLKKVLSGDENVIACWEGGSAATGYEDDYSDLDLAVVCKDDYVENVFDLIENLLIKDREILKRFRMPEPTWHGHSQCFYLLRNAPLYYYIDLAVMKLSSKDKLTESDRHGIAKVWFDKKSIIDTSPLKEDVLSEKCLKFLENLEKGPFWILEIEARKNCARGNYVDAKTSYDAILNRHLSGLVNLKYRKSKYDFGFRYSKRDLPPDVFKSVCELLFVSAPSELPMKLERALDMIKKLREEIKKEYG